MTPLLETVYRNPLRGRLPFMTTMMYLSAGFIMFYRVRIYLNKDVYSCYVVYLYKRSDFVLLCYARGVCLSTLYCINYVD